MMSEDFLHFMIEGISVYHQGISTSEATDFDIRPQTNNLETLGMA
jgi:hypothetical protein